ELAAREANGPNGNDFINRAYMLNGRAVGVGPKALVATQAQQYLAARRSVDQTDILVVVSTSRSGNYVIEELESAAMEEGTVVLTLDALRERMLTEGRIAIYGIRFATGSSSIEASSTDALETIVAYLRENPNRHFYVVGHTDDVGSLQSNMTLSAARAAAVVESIVAALPQARDRLVARGVGPLSPVATNGQTDGRALNRRVELVSTHE
ncbi:MAG: OmpA family protein, partial [Gammaproteobacteria bacterium]|nr:OmpA family protein [Gammaproteobacteria bacterium]